MGGGWIVACESDGRVRAHGIPRAAAVDEPVTIGRSGAVALGVAVPDDGISRIALRVTATPRGWRIENFARNGVFYRPWAQAEHTAPPDLTLGDPLVALRLVGARKDAVHRVLLEAEDRAREPLRQGETQEADPPRPLTDAEEAAVRMVFAEILRWPPPVSPITMPLKQAATRLGITASGVRQRLDAARHKAVRLGFTPSPELTDPGYLHALAAAGYLAPPPSNRPSLD
jgi:hypothetical protein